MSETKYIKIAEAAKQYNVSRTHIYSRIKAGKIQTSDTEGTTLVNETDVIEYVNSLKRRTKKSKKQKKGKVVKNELNALPKGAKVVREISIHINPWAIIQILGGVIVGYLIYTLIF